MPSNLKKHPHHRTTYAVGSNDVRLTITFGNKQMGASIVTLGKTELAVGSVQNLKVGKGTALTGKTLRIKSIVSDINDKTNWTSVRITLRGGPIAAHHDLALDVPAHGQSAEYRVAVRFT